MTELDEVCITELQLTVTSLHNGSSMSVLWSPVLNAVRYTVYLCQRRRESSACQV